MIDKLINLQNTAIGDPNKRFTGSPTPGHVIADLLDLLLHLPLERKEEGKRSTKVNPNQGRGTKG